MLDDYRIKGGRERISLDVEPEVARALGEMSAFIGIAVDELANTALRRFIAAHKDFLPPARQGDKTSEVA